MPATFQVLSQVVWLSLRQLGQPVEPRLNAIRHQAFVPAWVLGASYPTWCPGICPPSALMDQNPTLVHCNPKLCSPYSNVHHCSTSSDPELIFLYAPSTICSCIPIPHDASHLQAHSVGVRTLASQYKICNDLSSMYSESNYIDVSSTTEW